MKNMRITFSTRLLNNECSDFFTFKKFKKNKLNSSFSLPALSLSAFFLFNSLSSPSTLSPPAQFLPRLHVSVRGEKSVFLHQTAARSSKRLDRLGISSRLVQDATSEHTSGGGWEHSEHPGVGTQWAPSGIFQHYNFMDNSRRLAQVCRHVRDLNSESHIYFKASDAAGRQSRFLRSSYGPLQINLCLHETFKMKVNTMWMK